MRQNDRPEAADIGAALRLLTRLPLPAAGPSRAGSVWAWPLAGLVVGVIAAAVGMAARPLGIGVAAALTLGTAAMLTGAMHEDGLADCADGFWGGWDRERRLAIMRDSAVGSYGVMALLVTGLIRWSAIATLLGTGDWMALAAVAALSRVPMGLVMVALPNARAEGLSRSVGRPGRGVTVLAVVIGVGIAVGLTGWPGLAAVLAMSVTTAAVLVLAWTKIGGQTGDVLGASQILAECAGLAVLSALLN